MKGLALVFALFASASLCGAFTPSARSVLRRAGAPSLVTRPALRMSDEPGLKFNAGPEGIDDAPVVDQDEAMVLAMEDDEQEMKKKAAAVQLRPESELSEFELRERKRLLAVKKYAPWMADTVSPEAIAMREKAERERRDKKVEKLVGNRIDPAKQELSGSGLKIRVETFVDTGRVKLEWSTGSEESNLGFIVSRKGARDVDFKDIADFDGFQSLRSKGPAGGTYTFTDEDVPAGEYLYKVQDVAVGTKDLTEVCRKSIEVQTQGEQSNNVVLVGGFLALCGLLYAVGSVLDPQ
jgi:hypothetical protein